MNAVDAAMIVLLIAIHWKLISISETLKKGKDVDDGQD